MFTGIVEELGTVIGLDSRGDSARITVQGPAVVTDAGHGGSISVNGCCLTIVEFGQDHFVADVMQETLDKTSLGALETGSRVNLERAVAANARLGGHIVQGHVDGTGEIISRMPSEHWEIVGVSVPAGLARYLAIKGSIAIDGVSLTIVDVEDGSPASLTVSLIPETLRRTTLGLKGIGDPVNLEVDVIAKYVERLLTATAPATSLVTS